ncbi:hypothetical protein BGX26_003906 [Mortierella sp. AD094]|nr:hypothetical protein BGX26_003906 [Mortierella sp. AD094]
MFNHVYPAWHKPAQKAFFFFAAILCITLPAIYGSQRKPRRISPEGMGVIFGVYLGLWALFSLVVRFLVPSPTVESTLPSYDPSPIPEPAILHTPSRANAVPTSPAIRLHTPTTATAGPKVAKGARFADDSENELSSGTPSTPTERHTNNVTFQARPGAGYTEDSSRSVSAYPTYADYRQSQHGNFDAFAQRIKRAFATSQQQQQEQELRRQQELEQQHMQELGMVGLDLRSVDTESKNVNVSTATLPSSARHDANNNRRLSASSVNIFSDLADRIRNGFSRSQSNLPARSSTDAQGETRGNNSYMQDSQTQHFGVNATEIPTMEEVMADSVQGPGQQQRQDGRDFENNNEAARALSSVVPLAKEKEEGK